MGPFFTSVNYAMATTRFHVKPFCHSNGSLVFQADATI